MRAEAKTPDDLAPVYPHLAAHYRANGIVRQWAIIDGPEDRAALVYEKAHGAFTLAWGPRSLFKAFLKGVRADGLAI